MKTSAVQRKKLKNEKAKLAEIARQVPSQNKLDTMLMKYEDRQRKVIFKAMRPFLRFDAIYPTEESTASFDSKSFEEFREKYRNAE